MSAPPTPERNSNVSALVRWMRSRPSLDGVPSGPMDDAHDESDKKIASALLVIAQEFCGRTQQGLLESIEREADLKLEVAEWKQKAERMEMLSQKHQDELENTKAQVESTRQALSDSQASVKELNDKVLELSTKTQHMETSANQYKEQVARLEAESKVANTIARQREKELGLEIAEWTKKSREMETIRNQLEAQVKATKADLETTRTELDDSEARVQALNREVGEWKEKNANLESVSEEQEWLVESTKAKLFETEQALEESRNQTDMLLQNIVGLTDKTQDAVEAADVSKQNEDQLASVLDETKEALLACQEREEDLKRHFSEVIEENQKAKEKLAEDLVRQKEAILNAECALEETRQRLAFEEKLSKKTEEVILQKEKLEVELIRQKEALSVAEKALEETRQHVDGETEQKLEELSKKSELQLEEQRVAFEEQLLNKAKEFHLLEEKLATELASLQQEVVEASKSSDEHVKVQLERMENECNEKLLRLERQNLEDKEAVTNVNDSYLEQIVEEHRSVIEMLNNEKDELISKNVDEAELLRKEVTRLTKELASAKSANLRPERRKMMAPRAVDKRPVPQQDESFQDNTKENESKLASHAPLVAEEVLKLANSSPSASEKKVPVVSNSPQPVTTKCEVDEIDARRKRRNQRMSAKK